MLELPLARPVAHFQKLQCNKHVSSPALNVLRTHSKYFSLKLYNYNSSMHSNSPCFEVSCSYSLTINAQFRIYLHPYIALVN